MKVTKEFVEKNKNKRFNVTLKNGHVYNKIAFFIGSNYGGICYHNSRQKRYGSVWRHDNSEIKEIVEVKKPIYDTKKNIKSYLKKIHPNAWGDIKENLTKVLNGTKNESEVHEYLTGKVKYRRDIKKLLGEGQFNLLVDAFENKKTFSWHRNTYSHSGRDLSISTKLCDDGVFRAWFSSEYMGCGNGDYYLLINPTTAIYYERD